MSNSHFYPSRLQHLLYLVLIFPLIFVLGGCSPETETANAPSLSWTAPSEREDGAGIALSEIAGYRIYYGTESGDYQNPIDINDSTAVQAQFSQIPPGTYYMVATTVDTDGRESLYSNEVVIIL